MPKRTYCQRNRSFDPFKQHDPYGLGRRWKNQNLRCLTKSLHGIGLQYEHATFPNMSRLRGGEGNMTFLAQLLTNEEAATAVEYAVMLALIIGAIIVTVGAVGAQTGGMWGGIDGDLQAHGFGS